MSEKSLPFVESDPESESESTSQSKPIVEPEMESTSRSQPANIVSTPSPAVDESKPKMDRVGAEWEAHMAGVKARTAMADQPDVDAKALMQAMLKGVEIDGEFVASIDAVTFLLTQSVSELSEEANWKWLAGYGYQLAVMPWLSLFPDEAFELLEARDVVNTKAAIFALSKKISLPELEEFNAWCHEQLNPMSDSEKKGAAVKKQAKKVVRRK